MMTDMKRITVSFDDDIDKRILELRKRDDYVKCSYSEIVRKLVRLGLAVENCNRIVPSDTVSA